MVKFDRHGSYSCILLWTEKVLFSNYLCCVEYHNNCCLMLEVGQKSFFSWIMHVLRMCIKMHCTIHQRPRADVSRTRGTPWCCHMSACVFFSFWKLFINSRKWFNLQKFIINQPELRKLWNQFHNSSKIMIYTLE